MSIIDSVNGRVIQIAPPPGNGLYIGKISRKLMQWNIPSRGIVEMYINPQSFSIQENKLIKETRTKGGYVIQYWGEQLPEIAISGNTGSGGIEGINVLSSIYHQEVSTMQKIVSQNNVNFLNDIFSSTTQALGSIVNPYLQKSTSTGSIVATLAGLDPITVAATANTVEALRDPKPFLDKVVSVAGNVANIIDSAANFISSAGGNSSLMPTLASLAAAVELMYDGVIYRGFFRSFSVDERADAVGLFSYNMKFIVTRRTGHRFNGYPWQRSVDFGGADANNIPLSFGALEVFNTAAVIAPPPAFPNNQVSISRRQQITGR